jgi:predicted RNase H-like HicB family nuclease
MPYLVAVEDIEPRHWVAWVADLPGCFATGRSEGEAIGRVAGAVTHYARWRQRHGDPIGLVEPLAFQVDERFHSYLSSPDYRVNACFRVDRPPLTESEAIEAYRLLLHAREDLLAVLETVNTDDEKVREVVRHVAQAERWYFANLGLEQAAPDDDALFALDGVRRQSLRWLRQLVGNRSIRVVRQEGWTARKVLRRTLWHERDHTQHLRELSGARMEE